MSDEVEETEFLAECVNGEGERETFADILPLSLPFNPTSVGPNGGDAEPTRSLLAFVDKQWSPYGVNVSTKSTGKDMGNTE